MAKGRPESNSDDAPTGLKEELSSFLKDASAHVRIRAELLAIESKEAAHLYGRKFGLALAGLLLLLIGYLLILAGMIGILGAMISGSGVTLANWIGVAWALSGLHLIAGFLLLRKSKGSGSDDPVFEFTRNELKKDRQWLTNERKP